MERSILGGITGLVLFAVVLIFLYLGLYLVLGADGAFRMEQYELSNAWIIGAFILDFVAAAIGGYVAALIGKSGAVKILGLLVGLLAVMTVVWLVNGGGDKPRVNRERDIEITEAMVRARQPDWVVVGTPILALIGVFAGAKLRTNK